MPDEQKLKELVARIPEERCSAPDCGQPAIAVTQRGDRDVFLCEGHAARAARFSPVFQQTEDGAGIEEFTADRDAPSS
jgi:hypothetical protein